MDPVQEWHGRPPPQFVLAAAAAYLRFLSDSITGHTEEHAQGIKHAASLIEEFSEVFDQPKE